MAIWGRYPFAFYWHQNCTVLSATFRGEIQAGKADDMDRLRAFLYWGDRFLALWASGCTGGVAVAALSTYYLGSPPTTPLYFLYSASAAISLVRVIGESQSSSTTGAIAVVSFQRQPLPWNVILLTISLSALPVIDHLVTDRTGRTLPQPLPNEVPSRFLKQIPTEQMADQIFVTSHTFVHPSRLDSRRRLDRLPRTRVPVEQVASLSQDLPAVPVDAFLMSADPKEQPAPMNGHESNNPGSEAKPATQEQVFHPINRPSIHTGYVTVFSSERTEIHH